MLVVSGIVSYHLATTTTTLNILLGLSGCLALLFILVILLEALQHSPQESFRLLFPDCICSTVSGGVSEGAGTNQYDRK